MIRTLRITATLAGIALATQMPAGGARAAQTVTAGAVGSASASHWPMLIAEQEGFFAKNGLTVRDYKATSNAGVIQQLAAGSLDLSYSSGLVDPIRAAAAGAPVALVRIEQRASPYALLAAKNITSIKQLRGKEVIVGGAKDITRIYAARMLAKAGIGPGGVDYVYAGATSARTAALMSGAVSAALIAPPFIFKAQDLGYHNLGYAVTASPDLPFAGTAVNRNWAKAHPRELRRFLAAYGQAIDWFYQNRNRAAAIAILVKTSHADQTTTARSYDLFRKLDLFERRGGVRVAQIAPVVSLLIAQGDLPHGFAPARLLLPGGH